MHSERCLSYLKLNKQTTLLAQLSARLTVIPIDEDAGLDEGVEEGSPLPVGGVRQRTQHRRLLQPAAVDDQKVADVHIRLRGEEEEVVGAEAVREEAYCY